MDSAANTRQNQRSGLKNYSLPLLLGILLSCAYIFVTSTPKPSICGTPGGPPVTAPRIVLRDGRHLAILERGLPKEQAKHKLIFIHGSGGSRKQNLPISEEVLEELGVYMVSYDRAGYGESDPNPQRSVESEAYDVQDLADKLELGPKFYIVSVSIGGYTAWSCLKHIPHRLAGVVMFSPVTNFWWSGLVPREAYEAFNTQEIGDKLALLVAHYTPSLLYFWMTQKWFPTSSTMGTLHKYVNQMDRDTLMQLKPDPEAMQQGIFESKIRDKMVMFGNWNFDPADIKDPVPDKNGSVHIWHGEEDYLVPVGLQRYVHRKLPWIHYHELKGVGHMVIPGVKGIAEEALRSVLS